MLKKGTPVIFKRGSRWFKGRFGGKRDFAYSTERIKSLSDAKKKCFITSALWIKKTQIKVKESSLLDKWEVNRLYIKFKLPKRVKKSKKIPKVILLEGKLTPKRIEKHWWMKLNKKCVKCFKKCKQSAFTTIFCPSYKKEK